MTWLLPAVIATLASTLVLALAYAYLYVRDREVSMGIWTAGWAIYALRFVALLLDLHLEEPAPALSDTLIISNQLASLISGFLLLWGTYAWHHRRFPRVWRWLTAACSLWIVIATALDLSFWLLALPTFTLMGLIYIGSGVMLLKNRRTGELGETVTAWTLIAWGVHKLDYPFLRPVEDFAPWGYLLGALFGLISAIGIILIYFEEARQALSRSEARFRGIFETSPTGIAIVDIATQRFLEANKSYLQLLGYTREALHNLTVRDITHPDDWEREVQIIRAYMREPGDQSGYEFEKRYIRRDGDIRWVRVTGDVMHLHHDGLRVAVANVVDVTERKQAEARIRHLNRVLRAIRNVNQLIAREKDRDRLIQGACDHLMESRDYAYAWIALVDEDGTVTTTAVAGQEGDFAALQEHLATGEPVACVQRALAQEGLQVMRDPGTTCPRCPLAEEGTDRIGLTVQLRHGERRYGLLVVAAHPTFALDEEEYSLIQEVAGDIALALHDIEEEAQRRKAEAQREAALTALRQSEEKFRLIAEASAEDIWQLDVNGQVTYVSPAVERIFGYTPDEAMALGFKSFFAPAEIERATTAFVKAIAGEPYQLLIFTGRRQDGTPVPIEVSVTPVIQNDTVIGVQGIARDISDRRKAEAEREAALQALRTSEKKYRTLFEEALNPILMVDERGRYIDANAAALDFLECDRETLLQQSVWDYSPPGRREQQQSEHAPFLNRRTLETDYFVRGSIKTMLLNVVPVVIAGQTVLYGIGQDITERKRAQQALRESEEKYRALYDNAPLAYQSLDEDGNFLDVNPAWLTTLGYDRDEVIGRNFADFLHPDWQPHFRKNFPAFKRRGYVHNVQFKIRHKDGHDRDIAFEGCVGYQPDGTFRQTYCVFQDITERKRAQAEREAALSALKESEERFKLAMEASRDGLWDWDLKTDHVYYSPGYLSMLGYTTGEFEAHADAWKALLHPEDREATIEANADCIENRRETFEVEFRMRAQNGDWRWILGRGKVVARDREGRALRMVGTHTDITERKRASDELRRTNETLQALIESSPVAIVVLDPQGKVTLWNPAAEQMFGWAEAEVMGQDNPLMTPADQPFYDQKLQEQRHGKDTRMALRRRTKDGSPIDVWLSTAPLHDARGRVTGVIGIFEDITDRKRAEEARERLTRQMEQILATVPAGVLLLNAQRQIVQANPQARRELETLARIDHDAQILNHLGDRPLDELLTTPTPQGMWHEIQAGRRIFEAIARPMLEPPSPAMMGARARKASQRTEAWVLVFRDVTQERVIERHVQQQERLAAVGQLAAGIAHDFNNIMAVMVLYTQMALSAPDLPPKTRDRLDIVSSQARRATALIQQILDFSRRAVLERRPMDLKPFLKEVVKLLQRTVPENIKIDLRYDRDAYTVNADPTRMQQTILNLALNARDAMPEGGELHLTLGRGPATDEAKCSTCGDNIRGEWVWIEVTDTGCGIPPDVIDHIFEPFYTTKAPGEGTGLGLAQVFGLVKQHEGHITVRSEVDQGSTFTLFLPALMGEEPVMPPEESQVLVEGRGETILIVEDDAPLRQALAESLTALNYRVRTAPGGRAALDLLARHGDEIALILSDMVMPEMGGQALFQTMRDRGLTTPMIILSGHPLEKELQAMQAQGLAAWMLKPPDIEKLAQTLAQVLQNS